MSTLKTNAAQIGQSVTATNNFTLYQPTTPDGTVRLAVGNAGAASDLLIAKNDGSIRTVQQTSGTGGSNYVVKELPQFEFGGNSITDEYLLLFPSSATSNLSDAYQIMGRIYSSRGSASSGNNFAVDEINVGRAYNSLFGNIAAVAGSSTNSFVRLVTCTYGGVQWLAAKARPSGGPAHNGIWFEGWIIGEHANTFKRVRAADITNIVLFNGGGGTGSAPMMTSGNFQGINNAITIPIDASYQTAVVYLRGRHDSQGGNLYLSALQSDLSTKYSTENNIWSLYRGNSAWAATDSSIWCKLNAGAYTMDAGTDWVFKAVINQNLTARSSMLVDFQYTYTNVGAARSTGSIQYGGTGSFYGFSLDIDGSTTNPNIWAYYNIQYFRTAE